MLLNQIKDLTDEFYKACGELHENKSHIEEPHRLKVAENLFEMYQLDYQLIRLSLLEVESKILELKRRREKLKPTAKRRWYFPFVKKCNRAEELLDEEAERQAEEFLNHRYAALLQLQETLKIADKAEFSEAFDEPTTTNVDEPKKPKPSGNGQLLGQMAIEELEPEKGTTKAKKPATASITLTAKK